MTAPAPRPQPQTPLHALIEEARAEPSNLRALWGCLEALGAVARCLGPARDARGLALEVCEHGRRALSLDAIDLQLAQEVDTTRAAAQEQEQASELLQAASLLARGCKWQHAGLPPQARVEILQCLRRLSRVAQLSGDPAKVAQIATDAYYLGVLREPGGEVGHA